MIKINRIPQPPVSIYHNDKFIGTCLNENEFHDLRIQIAQQRAEGYTAHFNGHVISINNKGNYNPNPPGFYDMLPKQLRQLINIWSEIIQQERKKLDNENDKGNIG